MKGKVINFIASVEEKEATRIENIAQDLRNKGCTIKQVLTFSCVITGCSSGKEKNLEELKVKGIKHIEEDREVSAF